jgi:transketolase
LRFFDMKNDREAALKILRRDILNMAERSSHVAVALSCVDIIAVLYFNVMNITPPKVGALERDHFILSKGHGCMALYAVLARAGYMDPRLLETYAQNGSLLAEHPLAGKIPAVECATGTLGHGLAIAAGMAKGARLRGLKSRIFVLLGDGECAEGSVWEGAALAAINRLDNLVAIVDWNGYQACGACADISPGIDLAECWKAFGWQVDESDGHDCRELIETFSRPNEAGRPRVVLCRTVKGKGIDFMENNLEWHYRPVRGQERQDALRSLKNA